MPQLTLDQLKSPVNKIGKNLGRVASESLRFKMGLQPELGGS